MQQPTIEGAVPAYLNLLRATVRAWPLPRGKGWFVRHATSSYKAWPESILLRLPDGLGIHADLRDPMFRSLFFFGEYEREVTEVVETILRPGDTVLDAGANFGHFSLLAARAVGVNGRVHSFEPMPRMAGLVERNLDTNRLTNVKVNVCALGAERGTATIHLPTDLPSGHASLANVGWKSETQIACEVITLDDYLETNRVESVALFKIDVEGSELAAFQGAKRLLGAVNSPMVLAECNYETAAAFGYEPTALLEYLRSRNQYEFCEIHRDGLRPLPPGRKPEHGANVLCYVRERHAERLRPLLGDKVVCQW